MVTAGKSAVIPGIQYKDAHQAIEWLVTVLGFQKQAVYEGPDGRVMHAQLTFGDGMLMLGPCALPGEERDWDKRHTQPAETGGRVTSSTSLVVADADAAYAKVQSAGAEIVMELHTPEYGGKGFACKDPEGQLWYVGEYDPWAS